MQNLCMNFFIKRVFGREGKPVEREFQNLVPSGRIFAEVNNVTYELDNQHRK